MSDFDRISILPDEVLHQICSSLPTTRDAVRTSILSKRWRYLYLSVSTLSLDLDDFFIKKRCAKRSRLRYDALKLFLGRMLPHLDSYSFQMQTLQLNPSRFGVLDEPLFAKCLLVAAKRRIQHLDLSSFPGKIPPWIFASPSLLTLKLAASRFDAEDLNTACLPRLTSLNLMHLGLRKFSAAKLISGCPALQHLKIKSCFIDGDLDISSHMLQTLKLWDNRFYGNLSVSASALLSFKLGVWDARGPDFVEALHNVQELKLGPNALEILFRKIIIQEQLPTFSRLKTLKLNTYIGSGPMQAIACILQCVPSLEKLVITNDEDYRFNRKSFVLSEPSEDFLGNLKLLKVHGFPQSSRKGNATKDLINSCLSNAEGTEKKLIAKLFEKSYCSSW